MTAVRVAPLRELVEARREEIKAIVARHHGLSVAIFGAVARGQDRPGSDIDFLVELAPDARPIEVLSIGVELEEMLGVTVDVGTRRHCGMRCATRSWPRPYRFESRGRCSARRHRRSCDAIRDHLIRGGLDDDLVYDAVRVRLIEIGEAVKGVDPGVLDGVPWKEIARVRDHLAHRYFDTDHAIVRYVVDNDLDALADAVQSRLDRVGPGDDAGTS